MHVGILASNLTSSVGGGFTFEQEVFEAVSRLAPGRAHRLTFFVPPGARAPQLENSRVRVQALPDHRRPAERLRFGMRQLAKLATRQGRRERRRGLRANWLGDYLRSSGVDFAWYPPPAVADVPTADIPFLTIVWDLQHRLQPYFPEVSASTEWDLRERRYAAALRRATYIVTGTRAGQAEIERFYQVAAERICLLPHPTPRFALDAAPRDGAAGETATGGDRELLRKLGVDDDFLFYPAQLWPHKNHAGLFRAVQMLQQQRGIAPLVALSGSDKGNRAYLQALAQELGIAERIRWLGFVERRELIALYRQARMLVYPSFFGPENLPPLEAFACGCPVVAARVSGAEEQLADAALLFDPARPQAIADAIWSVWSDESLRQTLVACGRQRATRFTGDDFARGVFELFDEFEQVRSCWPRQAA
jgi:glycosyltransferase involved in cell wall biosynthesis